MKIQIGLEQIPATEFKAGDFAVEISYGVGYFIEVIKPESCEGMNGFLGKYIADVTEKGDDDFYEVEINKVSTNVFCGFAPNCEHYGPKLYRAKIINNE
jgi:hypothetical protein